VNDVVRTQDEIVARLRTEKERDPLGLARGDLLVCLDYAHAKEFLKPEVTEAEWAEDTKDVKPVREQMIDYVPFAWQKANDCRGLSASRSMNHFTNWLWLIGADLGDLMDYQYYGKDKLVAICKYLGLDPAKWDDGVRVNC